MITTTQLVQAVGRLKNHLEGLNEREMVVPARTYPGNKGHFVRCSGFRGRDCKTLVWINSSENDSGTCAQCAMEEFQR